MRYTALLIAVCACLSWGVGAVLIKRENQSFSVASLLLVQYAVGVVLVAGWILARGDFGDLRRAVQHHWGALAVIVVLQIAGYVFFLAAIQRAGPGSIPTAVATAIAAAYPAIVAILSGPFLGENLRWNHALGVGLVVGGAVVAQVL